jgi:nitrite reductase/ring-hydroxylating ferredoxin subunit
VVRGYLELQDCLILCDKNTRQFFTVKGSSSVTLINVLFQGRSSYYDIVVGDFTIYDAVDSDRPPSKLYLDDSFCEDGRKLRILCLHGDVFDSSSGLSLSDPRVSVTRVPSVLVKCWFFLCRLFTPSSRKREALATLADFPDVIED